MSRESFTSITHEMFDYDGCGTADRAIFRPSEGKWYIHNKTSALFGTQKDQPSVGASY